MGVKGGVQAGFRFCGEAVRFMRSEYDVRFRCDSIFLSGTLVRPSDRGATPAVILVPGSGHHDRDETVCGHRPFKTIAGQLAQHGIASLRFDGRGVGQSGGTTESVSFVTKVADVLAARRFLACHEAVLEGRIAFVGHSEGALVSAAASIDTQSPVAMLAGPAIPIAELLQMQAESQSHAAGASAPQIAHERHMNEQVFAVLASGKTPGKAKSEVARIIADALSAWPDAAWDSPEQIAEATETMSAIVLAEDYRSLLRQNPAEILSKVRAPILALFGELDCQVEGGRNMLAFEAATASNRRAQALLLPSHNHLFQVGMTGLIDEYEVLGQSPSSETLALLGDWLRETLTPAY